ncbi:hypothetical protein BH10PSE1_BH10PSE1_23190 [soil metagenome]
MDGLRKAEARPSRGSGWAVDVYLLVLGAVLGSALVVGMMNDVGRRVCGTGVVSGAPAAAILFGCDR